MALTDDLFQSIDTIVSARIANLPYDQTIECEVINADEAENGIYKVRYQATTFEATSSSTLYQVGDHVYVQVPQNDYKQDKIILNKKRIDETTSVKTLPFLTFAHDFNSNLFSSIQKNRELSIVTTSNKTATTQQIPMNLLTSTMKGYTRLGLKFATSANINYPMASGDYGIKLVITGYNQEESFLKEEQSLIATNLQHTFEFYLTTNDMIGSNLYNTLGYCNQEKVFDITNLVIKDIKAYLWQDGNFRTTSNIAVANRQIKFTNFQIYFGYDCRLSL